MNAAIVWINALSDPWSHLLLRASIEGAIALTLAWLLALACRSARLKCWWWRLAHFKLLLTLAFLTPLALPLLPAPKTQTQIFIPSSQSPPSTTARNNMLPSTQSPLSTSNLPASLSPQSLLLTLWLIGFTLSTLHLANTWRRTQRLRRNALPLHNPTLIAVTHRIAQTLHLSTPPTLLTSPDAPSPLLFGTRDPAILIPTSLISACSHHTLELILTHELAHLGRRDLWWNWLCSLAALPFFFHPAVWLARREWLAAQELACDELTLAASNAAPADYARTLLEVLTHCRSARPTLLTAGIGTLTTTKKRITAMHNLPTRSNRSIMFAATTLAALAVIGLLPWRLVAQSPPAPVSPPSSAGVPANTTAPSAQPESAHPKTFRAAQGHVFFIGNFTADTFTITQTFDGTPIKVNATEGTHVKRGDSLVQFDLADARRALNVANVQFNDAKSGSGSITSGAEKALLLAEIAQEKAQEDLAKTTVLAPIDGIVSVSNAKVGQFVTKGTQLVTIVDTSKLTMEGKIAEEDLGRIHVGQKITMVASAYPHENVDGNITFIAPTVDPITGVCVVKASVQGNTDKLKPGMAVTIEVLPD